MTMQLSDTSSYGPQGQYVGNMALMILDAIKTDAHNNSSQYVTAINRISMLPLKFVKSIN